MGVAVEADVSLGVVLGGKLDTIAGALDKKPPMPLYLSFVGQGTGPGIIRIGKPPAGHVWNILSFTLVGSDDHTTVAAASAALYVDADSGALALPLALCRIPGQVVPSFVSVSRGTLWAHSSGDVCVNVSGVAAGVQVVATVGVAEWRDNDVTQGTGRA